MIDSLEWFWQTDRVITVLHIAGARGAAIHQLITYSPEVDKHKAVEVFNGVAHINQESLGYTIPGDPSSQYHLYERWSEGGSGTYPAPLLSSKDLRKVKKDILNLTTRSGDTLPESVAKGYFITYRNHPGIDQGDLLWPNRRVIAVHNGRIGNSLRDYYLKQLTRELAPWQQQHLKHLGLDGMACDGNILDYYTLCHSGLEPDGKGHRKYLKDCLADMFANRREMLGIPGAYVIDADEFFIDGQWQEAYLDLCEFCGTTPDMDMASKFMHKYLSQQWDRDDTI